MRWLLHLDADELFLPAAAGSLRGTGECARSFSVENAARTHFQALDDAGVGLVTYKNREGVAEHADHVPDATNVFQSVACFREHFSDIPLTPAAMACMREWKFTQADLERTNVHGSGISLGHPVGATGGRMLATLARELDRRGGRYGLETMCIGGGQGLAAVFGRVGP